MMRRTLPLLVGGALFAGLALTACTTGTSSSPPAASPAASPAGEVSPEDSTGFARLAPVEVDVPSLGEGAVVEAMKGNTIDLTVAGDASTWTGTSSAPELVEFVPGGTGEDVIYNPYLLALGEGESTINLVAEDGTTASFVVKVTPSTLPEGAVY